MKRFTILLSAFAVFVLVLAACGADPTATPAPAAPEATQAPAPEPTEPPPEPTEPPPEPTEPPPEPTEPPPEPTEEMVIGDCMTNYEGETIVFYQQAGLTGPLATILGPTFINGTNDAVASINEFGGICGAQIEVKLTDTQYDAEQEIAAYQISREEEPAPMFILTYASPATIALKEFTNEDRIVNIASGLNAEAFYVPRDGWTVGTAPIYSDQFAGFVDWVSENWADVKPEEAGDDIVVGVIGWAGPFGAGATTPDALAYAESLGVTVLPLEIQDVSPTADVTGQLQNLLISGANVVYMQSLSFGPAQVIGTLRALGAWDSVVVGSVNWGMNTDVITLLGENAALANGYYGVFPYLWWNDTDEPGVQQALSDFEAGGYPDTDKAVGYLLSYGSVFAVADVIELAMNNVGFENLNGEAFFDAFQELGLVSASGLFEFDVRGENRAPAKAQIRQAQVNDEGQIEFVVIEDFFELPDTRPPAP